MDRAFTPPAEMRPVLRLREGQGEETIEVEADHQFANVLGDFATAIEFGERPGVPETILDLARLLDGVRRAAGEP